MRLARPVLALLVLLGSGACGATTWYWQKAGATNEEQARDGLECNRQATTGYWLGEPIINYDRFRLCLEARGYRVWKE